MSTNTSAEPLGRGLLRLTVLALGAVAGFAVTPFYAAYAPNMDIVGWILTPDGQLRFIAISIIVLTYWTGFKIPDTRSYWVQASLWFLLMAGVMMGVSSFFAEALVATSIGRQ